MTKIKILYADDEERMRRLVSDYLKKKEYEILLASNGKTALELFEESPDINLVILDVMMPKPDGYTVAETIRGYSDVPIILLTAKSTEYDELKGFSLGVDEYIKKPFSPGILMARIEALLKRSGNIEKSIYEAYGISVFTDKRKVLSQGEEIMLTSKEYDLLLLFIRNPRLVFSRQQIIDQVWKWDFEGDERTVDAHIKKLRAKLGVKGELIKTVWSVGYKFEE